MHDQAKNAHAFGKIWIASVLGSLSFWAVRSLIGLYAAQHFSLMHGLYLIALATVPNVIAIPFIGAIVDKFNPKMTSLYALLIQTLLLCVMGYCSHRAYPVWVVIISGLSALFGSFWGPARQRMVYSVIAKDRRSQVNSRLGSISGIMTIIGASCGAILSLWPTISFVFAAIMRIIMLGIILSISLPDDKNHSAHKQRDTKNSFWQLWKSGLNIARHSQLSWSIICLGIAWGLIGGTYERLLAYYIVGDLHGGEKIRFFYYIIDGLAVVIGTMLAARLRQRRHIQVYAISYIVQGLFWAGTFLTVDLSFSLLSLLIMRIASGIIIGLDTTILLSTIADDYHGRVMTVHLNTYGLVGRFSLVLVAFLASFLSLQSIGIVLGITSLLLGVFWWFVSGKKSMQDYMRVKV